MKARYFSSTGLTEETRWWYRKNKVDLRIAELEAEIAELKEKLKRFTSNMDTDWIKLI